MTVDILLKHMMVMSPFRVRLNLRSTKTCHECLLLSFQAGVHGYQSRPLGEILPIGETPERSCESENVSTLTKWPVVNG